MEQALGTILRTIALKNIPIPPCCGQCVTGRYVFGCDNPD